LLNRITAVTKPGLFEPEPSGDFNFSPKWKMGGNMFCISYLETATGHDVFEPEMQRWQILSTLHQ
jgi:hypothetical protein